jgi:hypothetical protein
MRKPRRYNAVYGFLGERLIMNKYYVNEEKGTVVSVYDSGDWGLYDFSRKVLKHIPGPMIYRNVIADIMDSNIFPIYPQFIRGVAKLGKNDSWDETKGKKIADQKVALKKNDRIVKQAILVKKHLLNIVKELDVIISKYSEKCAAIEEDFDRFYVKGE